MNVKVIYNFSFPGQESPGIVKLCYEAMIKLWGQNHVNVDSELCGWFQFSWVHILALSLTSFEILDRLVILSVNQFFFMCKMVILIVPSHKVFVRNELIYTKGSNKFLTNISPQPYHGSNYTEFMLLQIKGLDGHIWFYTCAYI